MATTIERAQIVINTLLGGSVDQAIQLRIVDRFMAHWQSEFDMLIADPNAEPDDPPPVPTIGQKADFFLKKMTDFGKDIVRAEGQKEARATVADDITEAGDTAAQDLE